MDVHHKARCISGVPMSKVKETFVAIYSYTLGYVILFAVKLFDWAWVFYSGVRDRVRKWLPKEKRT